MRRYRLFLLVFATMIISMKMAAQFYTLRPGGSSQTGKGWNTSNYKAKEGQRRRKTT